MQQSIENKINLLKFRYLLQLSQTEVKDAIRCWLPGVNQLIISFRGVCRVLSASENLSFLRILSFGQKTQN